MGTVVLCLSCGLVWADTAPGTINVQGRIVADGAPLSGSGVPLTFGIYDSSQLTTLVYAEQATPDVADGCYAVELGLNPQPTAVYTNLAEAFRQCTSGAWLTVTMGGLLLAPPEQFAAQPYAINTRGIYASTWNYVGIGTELPSERLHLYGADGSNAYLRIEAACPGAWGEAGVRIENPVNQWDLFIDDYTGDDLPAGNLSLQSREPSFHSMTWATNGNVGIGVTSPTATLQVAGSVKASGEYRFTIERTNYLTMNIGDFKDRGWNTYSNNAAGFRVAFEGGIMLDPFDTPAWYGAATVRLPQGAIVEEMGVLYESPDSAGIADVYLERREYVLTAAEEMAHLLAISTTPGSDRTTAIANGTIDNSTYNYWVQAYYNDNMNGRFVGVYLRYVTKTLIP